MLIYLLLILFIICVLIFVNKNIHTKFNVNNDLRLILKADQFQKILSEKDFAEWFIDIMISLKNDKDFLQDKFTFLSDIFISLDYRTWKNSEETVIHERLEKLNPDNCKYYTDKKCEGYFLQVSSDLNLQQILVESKEEFLGVLRNTDYLNVFFFGFLFDPDKLVSINFLLEKQHHFFIKKNMELTQMKPVLLRSTYEWVLTISFHIICAITFILFLLFNIIKIIRSSHKLTSLLEILNYENFFLIITFSQYFLQLFYFIKYLKIRTKNHLVIKENYYDIRLETYEIYQIEKMIASIFGGLFINLMVTCMIFFLKKYFFMIGNTSNF